MLPQTSERPTGPPSPEIGPMIDPQGAWETASQKIGPFVDPQGAWETASAKIGPMIDPNGVWETASPKIDPMIDRVWDTVPKIGSIIDSLG